MKHLPNTKQKPTWGSALASLIHSNQMTNPKTISEAKYTPSLDDHPKQQAFDKAIAALFDNTGNPANLNTCPSLVFIREILPFVLKDDIGEAITLTCISPTNLA